MNTYLNELCVHCVNLQTERCLYIFAGERNRDHLNDIWLFYVDTNEVKHIADVYCKDSLRGNKICMSVVSVNHLLQVQDSNATISTTNQNMWRRSFRMPSVEVERL